MIRFCVPTAISFITGRPYEEIEQDFKTHFLGDQLVEGIFLGAAVKLLKLYGYELKSINNFTPLRKLDINKTYLIHIRGHVGIIEEGMWRDNRELCGTPYSQMKKLKPLGIYEVIKSNEANPNS